MSRPMTIREIAAVLAALLIAGCSGGGGALSPLAPGVSGAPPTAAPNATLAVLPVAPYLPTVGATATVTATISTGAAGIPVTYMGGCENVATVVPTTQNTLAGGTTAAYTLTAIVASASCTARFMTGTATAVTSPYIGTATPAPTPSPSPVPTTIPTTAPTPVPTLGPLVVTPLNVNLGGSGNPTSAVITATQNGFSGAFSSVNSCTPGAYSVAAISGGGNGPRATWTVTQVAPPTLPPGTGSLAIPDTCTLTIDGAPFTSATVTITSTAQGLVIESKGRK